MNYANMPLAVNGCRPISQALYRAALRQLVDAVDGRIAGRRRDLYLTIAGMVGVVDSGGFRKRLMQFDEIDKCLSELALVGVIEHVGVGEVVDIRLPAMQRSA